MEYVGIACATPFISTSLPAIDNNISSHPWTLFQTQSFKYLKEPLTEVPTSDGIPKYLSLRVTL
jgi:hypothetical protein